jgi:hypothetical protein
VRATKLSAVRSSWQVGFLFVFYSYPSSQSKFESEHHRVPGNEQENEIRVIYD